MKANALVAEPPMGCSRMLAAAFLTSSEERLESFSFA